eukprot:SAG31_NODE_18390_length_638_cov_0.858998_1_plen_111_part_01
MLKHGVGRLERLLSCPLQRPVTEIWRGERRPDVLAARLPAAASVVIRLILQLLHEIVPAQSAFSVQFGRAAPNVSYDWQNATRPELHAVYKRDIKNEVSAPESQARDETSV